MKKTGLKILGLFLLLTLITGTLYSQTIDDVVNTYNKGAELANSDVKAAINIFYEAHNMAVAIGEEGNDIKSLTETQLPQLQYKYATELYKAKNTKEALENYEKAKEIAETFGDEKTKTKAEKIIPKLYFSIGNSYYKSKDYENALSNFDIATDLNPAYAKVYLSKGLAYKKQNKMDAMMEAMDQAIKYGKETNDEKTVNTAGKVVRDYLLVTANKSIQAESYQEAIDLLNKATGYGSERAQTYYLMAVANNKLSEWTTAIESANKGLEIENDDNEAKAKFYFELGNAYLGNGQNDEACAAYKNSVFGNYVEPANYQINTVLKCN